MKNKDFISVKEAAEIMSISRVAVFKKIKKGEIEAQKVGRAYVVNKRSLGSIYQDLTATQKNRIESAVSKVVREYGEALRKLGQE